MIRPTAWSGCRAKALATRKDPMGMMTNWAQVPITIRIGRSMIRLKSSGRKTMPIPKRVTLKNRFRRGMHPPTR